MNFKTMCEGYIEMNTGDRRIMVRRKIWPPNVHLLMGNKREGSPTALVLLEASGTRQSGYVAFGMDLVMNEERVILGWCPSIEDVMGQDWDLIKGR